MRFSANLGFLWADLPLPDAIHAAYAAGFVAVECHWPYEVPAREVADALNGTGLSMLSLNTAPGDLAAGDFGLAAVPGREAEARGGIDAALAYAGAIGAQMVHVMAGRAEGPAARRAFLANLAYGCQRAEAAGITLLIEPLNAFDTPGYFLKDTGQAARIIAELCAPNLKLMFDCYHTARTEGDVSARLDALLPIIGHIQIAGVPNRGPPDTGTLDYRRVFDHLRGLGWTEPLGAEYKAPGAPEASLTWMRRLV